MQSEIHAKIEYELSRRRQKKLRAAVSSNGKKQPCRKGKNSAPVFQRVSSLREPPKKTRMTPKERSRKYKKLTAQITNLTQQKQSVVEGLFEGWKHRGRTHTMQTQAERNGKK
jgi:hypothetical protein